LLVLAQLVGVLKSHVTVVVLAKAGTAAARVAAAKIPASATFPIDFLVDTMMMLP
jgi:hypothetical protein